MTPKRDLDIETRRAEFEATALPYMGALYNTARRLTHGSDDAGDLVQETFLRAYRTFDSFTPGTNCRGWLLTIMYSVFINQYHKTRRQLPTVSIDDLQERFQRYLESPDDAGEAAATVEVRGFRMNPEVDVALQQLPEEFRAPVLFVDVEGLSYDEAAAVLRCPVGTIRSRLYRGRRLLFAALKDYAATLGFRGGESDES
jgi:RNA polymerase sigma-70 factor (ECF subfamily)